MKEEIHTLKQQSGRSGACREYWAQTAFNLGLVDTPNGIRYSSAAAIVAHVQMSTSQGPSTNDEDTS